MMTQPLEYELPQSCPQGFTMDDLEFIFNPMQLQDFYDWIFGQTQALCNGQSGCHVRTPEGDYVGFFKYSSECREHPHGVVAYRWDVERYIEGGFRKAIWD